jgi:hypothetical protein
MYRRALDSLEVARCAADALVVLSDPYPRSVASYYWHMAQPWLSAVAGQLTSCGEQEIRQAAADLQSDPASAFAYWSLCRLVDSALRNNAERVAGLADAAHEASNRSRLGYHLGLKYPPAAAGISAEAQSAQRTASSHLLAGTDGVDVQIVIPFQDRAGTGIRTRNLMACLHSLRDQSMARSRYRITVVESDTVPQREATISDLTDEYLFAEKHGLFNKCWTVNVGAVHTSDRAGILCVLDADALVDRDFLSRNFARFSYPGSGAFLPFRDVLYADAATSAWLIGQRYRGDISRADLDCLRGFLVRRSPGMCAWMRRDVFELINGLDERYEGWGGEDLDLVLRLHQAAPLHFFDDPMIHMHHPVSPDITDENGANRNARIPLLSWPRDEPIGQIGKFRKQDAGR